MSEDFIHEEPFTFKVGDSAVKWYYKRLTPLANSSIFARWGDTVVNVSILRGEGTEENTFLPLTVEYLEKYYAAGIIASSPYVKREGHPSDAAILKARIIDRAIRPRFPKTLRDVVQVYVSVLSYDVTHDPLLLAFNTVVAALMVSDIPFVGDFVGLKLTVDSKGNPQFLYEDIPLWNGDGKHKAQLINMDMFLAVDDKGVIMFDAFVNNLPEKTVKRAVEFARDNKDAWLTPIREFVNNFDISKEPGVMIEVPEDLVKLIHTDFASQIEDTLRESDKTLRKEKLEELPDKVLDHYFGQEDAAEEQPQPFEDDLSKDFPYTQQQVQLALEMVLKKFVKDLVLKQNERLDGRDFEQVRDLYAEIDLLPRVHGSALFKRGDTMVLTATTLGSLLQQLQLDEMTGEEERYYIHEYYSPPYGFGEPGRFRAYPGRREIGHGALAEKALLPVIPSKEEFPYMVRVVSEVMSSAGSTSMASATASSLSLMSAGVPIKKPVAGISIGVIGDKDFTKYQLLTDIVEVEDFYGEMDFKVAGTKDGITAIQMDQKRLQIPYHVILEAFDWAKRARLAILDYLTNVISEPKKQLHPLAPKVLRISVPVEDIGKIIGPGGRIIKDIMERTDTKVYINEEGTVQIMGKDTDKLEQARQYIQDIVNGAERMTPKREYKVGEVLEAEVVELKPFGAIVKLLDGTDSMAFVHISEIADFYIKDINNVLTIGEHVKVKIVGFDDKGRLRASIKQVE